MEHCFACVPGKSKNVALASNEGLLVGPYPDRGHRMERYRSHAREGESPVRKLFPETLTHACDSDITPFEKGKPLFTKPTHECRGNNFPMCRCLGDTSEPIRATE